MKKIEILFGILRIPLDALAVGGALVLSYQLRILNIDLIPGVQLLDASRTLPSAPVFFSTFVVPSIAAFIMLAASLRSYALTITRSAWLEVGRTIIASLLWLVAVMAWFFLVRKELFYSRILLLHAVSFMTLFVLILRAVLTLIQRLTLKRGIGVRYVLSIGAIEPAQNAYDVLTHDYRYNYLGHKSSLEELKRSRYPVVDLVIQTDPDPSGEQTVALIDYCRSHHIGYAFLPPVFADVPHQLMIERLGLLPLVRFQPTPLDGWGRVWKRLFDIIGSIILIIILSPLMLLTAIAILIDDGLPIFYISRRVGEHGAGRIPVLKFRSMIRDAETKKDELIKNSHRTDGPLFKMKDDPRVTPVGRFIRRWTLDELPQLFNVLIGQMSLVGPRPHLPEEVSRYTEYQRRVFAVRPGVTGYAQVSGRSDLPFEQEVHFDLQYIEEWSLLFDLWILWRTVVVVLGGKGAD